MVPVHTALLPGTARCYRGGPARIQLNAAREVFMHWGNPRGPHTKWLGLFLPYPAAGVVEAAVS